MMDDKTIKANKDNNLKYMTGIISPDSPSEKDKEQKESTNTGNENLEYFCE